MGSKPLYFAHNGSSTVLLLSAEYACPVWERSAHAEKIDSALNDTCRRITGCLKPTPLNKVYSLAGIAPPPSIRREVSSQSERQKCNLDQRQTCVERIVLYMRNCCNLLFCFAVIILFANLNCLKPSTC